MSQEKKIEISEIRFKQLEKAEELLDALLECGVDNWNGFADANDLIDKREQEELNELKKTKTDD
jgi:hypothetical protein